MESFLRKWRVRCHFLANQQQNSVEGAIGRRGLTRGHTHCFKDLAWTFCSLAQTIRLPLPSFFFFHSIYKQSFSLHHDMESRMENYT